MTKFKRSAAGAARSGGVPKAPTDADALPPLPFGYSPTWAGSDKYNVKSTAVPDRPVRLALAGFGGIALAKHLPAIRRLRDTGTPVEVVCVCDTDPHQQALAERVHNTPSYGDCRSMFDKHAIDAVAVLTDPGEGRLQVLEEVIERKVALFVEKPLLFLGVERSDETVRHARSIIKKAAAKNLVVAVGFSKRHSPPYLVAKQLVESNAIGEISMIAVKMCQGWSRHILLEGQACHLIHIALWIGGPIAGLQALGANRFAEPNYPYDNVVVNVAFASGAVGTFYFNSSSPSLKPWERLEIFGERRWLAVEDGATVTLHDSDEGPSKVWSPVVPHTLLFDEEFGGFTGELQSFIAAIEGKNPEFADGQDGLDALIVAHMIHTSIAEHRYVAWAEAAGE